MLQSAEEEKTYDKSIDDKSRILTELSVLADRYVELRFLFYFTLNCE